MKSAIKSYCFVSPDFTSRPFLFACCYVTRSGVFFVNKPALPLVDFKSNVIKWKLHFVSCNFGLKSNLWLQITLPLFAVVRVCHHAFDFIPNCTPLSAITIINCFIIFTVNEHVNICIAGPNRRAGYATGHFWAVQLLNAPKLPKL